MIKHKRPSHRLPSLFDDFFTKDLFEMAGGRKAQPAVNIKETEKEFRMEVFAPGMEKENFNISLEEEMLTISAEVEHSNEEKDEDGHYTRREFSKTSFSRSFRLPEDKVKEEEIEAIYSNGVLHVNLPKKEEEVQKAIKRSISIS